MNITENAKKQVDSCRFCWMCRHICPIGNATGLERNCARARALGVSVVARGAEKIDNIIDNIYECALCGACTNNCITGWNPKIFIQEVKTDAVLNGVIPKYIEKLLQNYQNSGNVFGAKYCDCLKEFFDKKGNVLFIIGQDALYKSCDSVYNACTLLDKANVKYEFNEKANDTGSALWFLTGKTAETVNASKNCALIMNKYDTVVVYNPVDLKLIKHEYKEWGIDVKAKVVGFNEFILSLIENKKLEVVKGKKEYTIQDNYAYARDLDDSETSRKIVEKVGCIKEMLLNRKEANMAGHLIMAEYMPNVQKQVALDRWNNAKNMDCFNIVTENPDEYEMLKATKPEGFTVLSIEEMILENLR